MLKTTSIELTETRLLELASHVLPEDPGIDQLRRLVLDSQRLPEHWSPGYQSGNRDTIWQGLIIACDHIRRAELVYEPTGASAPSSGADPLVRRRPAEVLGQQIASPAELCVLGAALFESLGLYPVLASCESTLLFGCWLMPRHAAGTWLTDPVQLDQLLQANELLLLDTTTLFGADDTPLRRVAADAATFLANQKTRGQRLLDLSAYRFGALGNPGDSTGDETYIRTRIRFDSSFDGDNDTGEDAPPADFDAPVPNNAATAALAVALNMPRATPDWEHTKNLDGLRKPTMGSGSGELMTTLPADGDQRQVLKAASVPENYNVLTPPGSAGSQTVVNLLAQLLRNNRSVLCLTRHTEYAQKIAGHVVQTGLSALCELDLPGAADIPDPRQPINSGIDDGRVQLAKIQRQRQEYAAHLHSAHGQESGWSLHYAMGVCAQIPDDADKHIDWHALDPDNLPTPAQLAGLDSRLKAIDSEHLASASADLAVIGQRKWSGQWEESLISSATELVELSDELDEASRHLAALLELPKPVVTRSQFVALQVLCEELPGLTGSRLQLACLPDLSALREALNNAVTLSGHYDQLKRGLAANYRPDAELNLPLDQLVARHERAQSLGWPRQAWQVRRMRRDLGPQVRGKSDPMQDIPILVQMRAIREQLRADHQLVQHFAAHWSDVNSDFLTIAERLDEAEQMARTFTTVLGIVEQTDSAASSDHADTNNEATRQVTALANRLKTINQQAELSARCNAYASLAAKHQDQLKCFVELASPRQRISGSTGNSWAEFIAHLASCVTRRRWDIKDWCAWREITGGSLFDGYQQLMERVASGEVSSNQAAHLIQYACARCWLEKHLNRNDPDLPDEVTEHLRAPAQHRHLASRYRQLVTQQLVEQHDNEAPACLVTTLTNYQNRSDFERRRFDDIVFADADQVSVTNAIQVMAYGTRAVFIGDPARPMDKNQPDRYHNLTDGVASQGVLQAAIALDVPTIHLRHDYAARNPDLIAQANRMAPQMAVRPLLPVNDMQESLQLTQVDDATWGPDASDNPAEAARVVIEVLSLISDAVDQAKLDELDLGIVAMTNAQVARISDLFERAAFQEPSKVIANAIEQIEVSLADTVSGMHQLVVFSTTAACPAQSDEPVLDMFYGDTGVKRLYNVVSSARERLHIVTSLGPEDFVGKSEKENPALELLNDLLTEAANQHSDTELNVEQQHLFPGTAPPPFSMVVRNAMSARGWQIAIPSTVFGAGIDLIVENPDEPGSALAGVVTDSGFFNQARLDVIRRDDCQERALIEAGWELVQTWPQQWWTDANKAQDLLDQALRGILDEWRQANRRSRQEQSRRLSLPKFRRLTIVDLPYCDPDALFDENYNMNLRRVVQSVIQQEGPIRHDILLRRVARLHQRNKLTAQIKARIEAAVVGFTSTQDGEYRFIWPQDLQPEAIHFRPPASHEDKRQLAEISQEELTAAARHFAIDPDEPNAARALARAIGLAYPASKPMRLRLKQALRDATAN